MKLSDKVYEKFKQHLVIGDLKPGQFISQRELVTLTGVPLAPVREALLRLELEGVVQIARADAEGYSDDLLKDAQSIDDKLHDTIVSALGNELVDCRMDI